jgi:hypothetical protein
MIIGELTREFLPFTSLRDGLPEFFPHFWVNVIMTDVREFNLPRRGLRRRARLGYRRVGMLRWDMFATQWGNVSLGPTGKARGPYVHHRIIILDIILIPFRRSSVFNSVI